MNKEGKFVDLKYEPAMIFSGSTKTVPEHPEEVMYVACFMSNPEQNLNETAIVNYWMCFTDEQAILNCANSIKDDGGKIDSEYSFIIKPGKTYKERTPLVDFLDDHGYNIDEW